MDELDFEKNNLKFLKEDLEKKLEMSPEELELFSTNFLKEAINHIAKGGCINFTDYKGKNTIYSIPIKLENLKIKTEDMYKYHVTDFLGYVLDEKDSHYNRICRINSHDWLEYGIFDISFSDGTRKNFSDNKIGILKIYFRKPLPLNPFSYPTFENFLQEFNYRKGNFQQLNHDYQKLFNEHLPKK